MNMLKLTATLAFIFLLGSFVFISCDKKSNSFDKNNYSNKGIPMSGAQNVPPNSSAATGTLDVNYSRGTHLLTYTITWSGLSGPPVAGPSSFPGITFPAIGIYGLADPGYMAVPYPGLAHFPNGVAQSITGFPAAASGTYSSTLHVDGVVIKESDLLNGKFYVMIRTAAFPNGQIRGQIYFQP